jgi:hypothetical protein
MPDIPDAAVQLVAERMLGHHKAAHPESHLTWRDFAGDARADLEAAAPLLAGTVVTEHANLMPSGDYNVWNTAPYVEQFYPLAKRIEHNLRNFGKVYHRRVIVVEDWMEISSAPRGAVKEDEGP